MSKKLQYIKENKNKINRLITYLIHIAHTIYQITILVVINSYNIILIVMFGL